MEAAIDVVIAGGDGHLGARVRAAVQRRGHDAHVWDPRVGAPATTPDVVVDARPASADRGAVEVGAPVVDVSVAPFARPGASESPAAVSGAGWFGGLGDLLAALAARTALAPAEVHATYWVPGRRALIVNATDGERRDLWRLVTGAGQALVHGERHDERVGEARRLAWFPRPVGPHHAAAITGAEHRTVPLHVAGVQTVRTHVALASWMAEVVQGIGGLSRLGTVDARLRQRAESRTRAASTTGERWACVVEVQERNGDVHRAWAYGTDRHGVAAELAAAVAVAGPLAATPQAPAQVVDPAGLLDELADRSDLRWSTSQSPGRAAPPTGGR